MPIRPARFVALLVVLVMAFAAPRRARGQALPDEQDAQLWIQALAIGSISTNWRTHLELQPRIFDNVSELGLTLVRSAIGRRVTPWATAFVGHAWVPRSLGPVTRHERRLWQQLSLTFPAAGAWTSSGRVRLEQRWLDQWADVSHRLRLLVRAQRRLDARGAWSLALYDEAMVTLDDTRPGPARGYDRNRLYGGVIRRLSPVLSAEFGYIWENSTIPGPLQRNDHVTIAVLNISVPRAR